MAKTRPEQPIDAHAIRNIHRRAFGGNAEADLVDRLRNSCPDAISVVAQDENRIVGHILFTPAVIRSPGREQLGMALAPMAVLPEYQRRGIGSNLVRDGLETVGAADYPFVVVLGHPEYYPRFGFVPASNYQVTCEFAVPDEVFMLLVLDEKCAVQSGVARYDPAFYVWK